MMDKVFFMIEDDRKKGLPHKIILYLAVIESFYCFNEHQTLYSYRILLIFIPLFLSSKQEIVIGNE